MFNDLLLKSNLSTCTCVSGSLLTADIREKTVSDHPAEHFLLPAPRGGGPVLDGAAVVTICRSASPDGLRQICFAFNGAQSNGASGQPASSVRLRRMNIYLHIAALIACKVCSALSSTNTEARRGACYRCSCSPPVGRFTACLL